MTAINCSLKYFISILLFYLVFLIEINNTGIRSFVCLYGWLFVWCFSSHSRIFAKLQILTLTPHSLTLISEGSLAYCTYCDTRHPFTMVISEDPWNSHLLPSVWQWTCHYPFKRLENFSLIRRRQNFFNGEDLQIWTYTQHLWPLSSSSTCHTNCHMRLPFIVVIFEEPRHSQRLASVW